MGHAARAQRVVDGRLVRVRRDFEFEGRVIETLEKLRFVPLYDESFRSAAVDCETGTVFVPDYDVVEVDIQPGSTHWIGSMREPSWGRARFF